MLRFDQIHPVAGLATLVALGLAVVPQAAHAQGYLYTAFSYPNATNTTAYGLNNNGQIVGSYDVFDTSGNRTTAGFSVNAGLLTPAGFASYSAGSGITYTRLDAINNSGQTVGDYVNTDGTNPGFQLSGQAHNDILPAGYSTAVPGGINTGGTVSGTATDTNGVSHVFTRTGAGVFTTFDDAKADVFGTNGTGNNDAGTVVGYYVNSTFNNTAFTFKNGAFTDLTIPSAVSTIAYDINNAGDIAGSFLTASSSSQGFLLTAGGSFLTFNVPGAVGTEIFGVNDSRQVVGDWTDAAGNAHGFFATPTPEPSSWAVLGLGASGLAALTLRARRRRAA